MILVKKAVHLAESLASVRALGQSIGFVPTMGALHPGHLSLLQASRSGNQFTVCSIFVNPTQFNDPKDFEKYPVTIEKDLDLLENAGVDLVFLPTVTDIYPGGTSHLPSYELGYLETILEGYYRPGHFQGVCQVMHRLLELVGANDLYMGQKDYQQCMVIKKLLELTGIPTQLHTCPTLREADGLAMSSRNMRLKEDERKQAVQISAELTRIKQTLQPGPLRSVCEAAEQSLTENGFKVDYVALAAADNLELLEEWDGQRQLVVLAAAWLQEIRLIDNMLIH